MDLWDVHYRSTSGEGSLDVGAFHIRETEEPSMVHAQIFCWSAALKPNYLVQECEFHFESHMNCRVIKILFYVYRTCLKHM